MWKAVSPLPAAALAVVLFSSPPPAPLESNGEPLLPRYEFLHALGAAEQNMVADYYWIGAIQQLGIARDRYGYGNVYYYADLVTDLDPGFYWVYAFAATAVTYNLGHEHWVNTDESTRIVLKGLSRFPNDRYLSLLYAYNLMYFSHEYREAGLIVRRLSTTPGAPSYLAPLATRLLAQGGEFNTALEFAETLRNNAQDDQSREFYDRRVKEIRLEAILQRIDAASEAYFKQYGRLAPGLNSLVAAKFLPPLPPDPLGGTLFLDKTGRGESTAEKHRLEVYGLENAAPAP